MTNSGKLENAQTWQDLTTLCQDAALHSLSVDAGHSWIHFSMNTLVASHGSNLKKDSLQLASGFYLKESGAIVLMLIPTRINAATGQNVWFGSQRIKSYCFVQTPTRISENHPVLPSLQCCACRPWCSFWADAVAPKLGATATAEKGLPGAGWGRQLVPTLHFCPLLFRNHHAQPKRHLKTSKNTFGDSSKNVVGWQS